MSTLLATGWDAVNRYRKIEEATAPKDDPAPVYLLDEIADLSKQSPEAATAIAEAVQKKLAAKHPVVKFKALRIIKHLSTKGCSQFQRCMQRHSTCVRELIHWRGEPDPFKGDVPNARVREFAKEVVEVMFNTTPIQNTNNTLAAQGKIQGFGSGGPEQSSSNQYGGIGSSGSQYGGIGSSGSYSGTGSYSRSGGMSSGLPTSLADAQRAASQLSQAAQQALGEGPLAQGLSNVLGGFLQPAGYSGRLNETNWRDASPEASFASSTSYAAPAVSTVTATQVLGSESALVDDITTPGGLRALPDPADLRRFVDTASSMDGLRVAELLREKMESPRWQVVLRALAALEAVLQRGSSQACGEVAVMFQSDPSPVRSALSNPQLQVQQLAAAALKLLTGEEVQVSAAPAAGKKGAGAAAAAAAAAAAKAPMMDLLIDDSPSEPTAAAAAPASGIDLLGDLTGPAPAAAPAAPAAAPAAAGGVDSLFDGLGVHSAPAATAPAAAPAPAAPAAASNGDMFGGLTVETVASEPAPAAVPAASTAAPAAAAAAAASSKQSAPLDELFSGLSTNPHQANNSSNLLSSLSQPQPLQQQHPGLGLGAQPPQLQQQQPPPQQDWLGGDLGVPGPKMQQPGLGAMQFNGLQQQQQPGMAGYGVGGAGNMGQQQQWSMGHHIPAHSAGVAGSFSGAAQQHNTNAFASLGGAGGTSGSGLIKGGSLQGMSGGGAAMNTMTSSGSGAWSGHDDVSNLMRQVAHGGKYDPAFDFVTDEFKAAGSKR